MKNLLTFIFFITALVLFVQLIQAKTAEQIIEAYIEARGGIDKLNLVNSIRINGTMQILEDQLPVVIKKIQQKIARTDFEINGQHGFLSITPDMAYAYIPGHNPAPVQIPVTNHSLMIPELDIVGLLINHRNKGNKIELQGKAEVNGSMAYQIKLTTPSGLQITYFINRQSKLLVQSHQNTIEILNSNQPHKTKITNYEKYAVVNDILFPHYITDTVGNQITGKLAISSILLNEELDLHQLLTLAPVKDLS